MNGAPVAPSAPQAQGLKSFAQGTALYPVPISSGQLVAGASGGNTSVLRPIPKSGFLSCLRFTISGTLTVGTAGTAYTVPLWLLISNYTLQNSLNYPYRSLAGADIHEWVRVTQPTGSNDPLVNSSTFNNPVVTSTGAKNFSFSFVDPIGQNDGVNFSRYLLSAMTTSNDLAINITWLAFSNLAVLAVGGGTVAYTAYTATCQVSAEYLTVPDPSQYAWPRRNLVQQALGDPSYNSPVVGLNTINLTPIQGPEFTGLGIQVLASGGVPDSLLLATSGITEIDIYVNGTIPLMQFTLADMISRYERLFQRPPAYGYLFIDLSSDLSIPNVMSHTHRKVLSTSKYSQISVRVTLNSNFTPGAGNVINLLKRTQQAYASNG
jgi:hypothetical protein